jgi:Ca2+-binding RTX toxin-like protein
MHTVDQGLDTFVSISGTLPGKALDISGLSTFTLPAGKAYFDNLLNDPFLSYVHNGKKVIYGTPGNDELSENSREKSLDDFEGYYIVGGTGEDVLNGSALSDELIGGTENDILLGNHGKDTLQGSQGNDTYIYTSGDGFDTTSACQ